MLYQSQFQKIFNLILEQYQLITEVINPGNYPVYPYFKQIYNKYEISKITNIIINNHAVNSDAKRLVSMSLTQSILFKNIDEMCVLILQNSNHINFINTVSQNRFCGLLKYFNTESNSFQYFKIILNFQINKKLKYTVFLKTLIEINRIKYQQLITKTQYIDSTGLINKIIVLPSI